MFQRIQSFSLPLCGVLPGSRYRAGVRCSGGRLPPNDHLHRCAKATPHPPLPAQPVRAHQSIMHVESVAVVFLHENLGSIATHALDTGRFLAT